MDGKMENLVKLFLLAFIENAPRIKTSRILSELFQYFATAVTKSVLSVLVEICLDNLSHFLFSTLGVFPLSCSIPRFAFVLTGQRQKGDQT